MAAPPTLVRVLGDGACGVVYEALVDGHARAVKLVDDAAAFAAERDAYEALSTIDELRGRVCSFYGTVNIPQRYRFREALSLELLQGKTLTQALVSKPPAKRDNLHAQLKQTLGILHDRAGVCHYDVRGSNVIVAPDGASRLLDFSHSRLRSNMTDADWKRCTHRDRAALDAIFERANAVEAEHMAVELVKSMKLSNASDEQQQKLAELLYIDREPSSRLVLDIRDAVTKPIPKLALVLALYLEQKHLLTAATTVLSNCLAAADAAQLGSLTASPVAHPPDGATGEEPMPDTMLVRHRLAQVSARLEANSTAKPSTFSLYDEAIQAMMRYRKPLHPDILNLKLEQIEYLRYIRHDYSTALGMARETLNTIRTTPAGTGDCMRRFSQMEKELTALEERQKEWEMEERGHLE